MSFWGIGCVHSIFTVNFNNYCPVAIYWAFLAFCSCFLYFMHSKNTSVCYCWNWWLFILLKLLFFHLKDDHAIVSWASLFFTLQLFNAGTTGLCIRISWNVLHYIFIFTNIQRFQPSPTYRYSIWTCNKISYLAGTCHDVALHLARSLFHCTMGTTGYPAK